MELDADSGDDFQATRRSHNSGAEKSRLPTSRRVLDKEGDVGSPRHDDISPARLNFEKPSLKSKAGYHLAG